MENKIDSLIQLKQATIDTAHPTVIPIVTTVVPSTFATKLAPTGPMAIALLAATTTTLATTSTTTGTTGDEANRLSR